jgi:hypothetical protein
MDRGSHNAVRMSGLPPVSYTPQVYYTTIGAVPSSTTSGSALSEPRRICKHQ